MLNSIFFRCHQGQFSSFQFDNVRQRKWKGIINSVPQSTTALELSVKPLLKEMFTGAQSSSFSSKCHRIWKEFFIHYAHLLLPIKPSPLFGPPLSISFFFFSQWKTPSCFSQTSQGHRRDIERYNKCRWHATRRWRRGWRWDVNQETVKRDWR